MKREAKLLLGKACDSLLLAIEIFNRPHDRGRVSSCLILLDHSFEMLLKASLLERRGKIRDRRAKETIGFDACVRRALSDGVVKFLTTQQALTLQIVNGLRDAAQHHLLDISEGQLYIHAQSSVTLFRDILRKVFEQELSDLVPGRVLPISTLAPTDLVALFEQEASEIQKLLRPGLRRRVEAHARIRPLAILDAAIRGEKGQPSTGELHRIGKRLAAGETWGEVFVSVAAVDLRAEGDGPSLSLRFTKKEGIPVHVVPEGTPGASVVGVRRVDELGFYNLGTNELAQRMGLTMPKTVAAIRVSKLDEDPKCSKEFRLGKSRFKRYSHEAAKAIEKLLSETSIEEVWRKYRSGLPGS